MVISSPVAAASWSAAGEGEQGWFLGTLATIKVAAQATSGRLALLEFLFPRHASPPLHTHPQGESYIVDARPAAPTRRSYSGKCDVEEVTRLGRVLACAAGAGLVAIFAAGALGAAGPVLRSAAWSNGRLVLSVDLGKWLPGEVIVSTSPHMSGSGPLADTVRLRTRLPTSHGSAVSVLAHLRRGTYYTMVSGVSDDAMTSCVRVRRSCGESWSRALKIVIR